MSEAQEHRATAVEQLRHVRDQLNREIEKTPARDLLDHVREHRYVSPVLQRLASRAVRKADAAGAAAGSH